MKTLILQIVLLTAAAGTLLAHPLGIFSVNRYSRIELTGDRVRLVYIMDVAEIPAMQEVDRMDPNNDGMLSESERSVYAKSKIEELQSSIHLTVNGYTLELIPTRFELSFPEGQGGLKTVRFTPMFETFLPKTDSVYVLVFSDENFREGRGWKEIVVASTRGEHILSSSVPERDVSNELLSYPVERQSDPLMVSEARITFTPGSGDITSRVESLGKQIVQKASDGFAELISAKDLSTSAMVISLFIALLLGAGHALTPGHGKTIVAAYLVGSRGTAKHAAFLGLTVTATHTIGVFAMGFIALFASQYVVPEKLFPWLSLISGIIVVGIGISLFKKRFQHARQTGHSHDGHTHDHNHDPLTHTHDGQTHSHVLPGTNGMPVTWKSLFALGVSGGLLPCPSAIVVLLSAIALGRVGFGLLLIVAFSIGLAGVLTGIGLLMVYARRFFERFNTGGSMFKWMPVASAAVVAVAGTLMSSQAFGQTGIQIPELAMIAGSATGGISILVLGFVLGLKHALDTDHLVAVSTIVSERRGILSSSIVGALWGLGHTVSLVIVGFGVIALDLQIPERLAQGMEFTVALMLVALGINVLYKVLRGGNIHAHVHTHEHVAHVHPHVHEHSQERLHTHHGLPFTLFPKSVTAHLNKGKRSVFIGMVHGLAGSAALMLIVLATIPSPGLALAYIGIFGIGSIGGMMIMSALIGLPFMLAAHKSERLNVIVRGASGLLSVGFGVFYGWQIAVVGKLFF